VATSLMSPSAHAMVVAPPNATSASRIASAIRFIDLTSPLTSWDAGEVGGGALRT